MARAIKTTFTIVKKELKLCFILELKGKQNVLHVGPHPFSWKTERYYIELKGEWDDVGMFFISKVIQYTNHKHILLWSNNWIKEINRDH